MCRVGCGAHPCACRRTRRCACHCAHHCTHDDWNTHLFHGAALGAQRHDVFGRFPFVLKFRTVEHAAVLGRSIRESSVVPLRPLCRGSSMATCVSSHVKYHACCAVVCVWAMQRTYPVHRSNAVEWVTKQEKSAKLANGEAKEEEKGGYFYVYRCAYCFYDECVSGMSWPKHCFSVSFSPI